MHAVEQARRIGEPSIFLGSSKKLQIANRLYKSVGFEHVPPASLPPMLHTCTDGFMQMKL